MTTAALDTLLAKLNEGDSAAVETVFLTYEPYLRMVVRRRLSGALRAKFDSMDVVQSIWADLFRGFASSKWRFQNTNQLRAFLIKVTYNRFVDRIRRDRAALAHEVALNAAAEKPCNVGRVSEQIKVDDLWQRMLNACPPAHHEILRLKRAGASLAEIASRTGLHPSSIRRILYDVARRVGVSCSADEPRRFSSRNVP